MFVGEGPGQREDEQGQPFVGAAGQFLEQLLRGAGLSRGEVYITNVVKCRPPGNRDPEPDEIAACRSYLDRQIEAVNPPVIVTLGRFSMQRWFADSQISRIHGQARALDGRTIVPMYHPAAALRRGDLRPVMAADFAQLPALAAAAIAAGPRPVGPAASDAPTPPGDDAPPQSTLL